MRRQRKEYAAALINCEIGGNFPVWLTYFRLHGVGVVGSYFADTDEFYTIVQQKILDRFGKKFEWSLKSKMMGKKALEAGKILVKDLGLEGQITAEEYIAEREAMLQPLFPTTELLPGVEDLIRHLHAHGIPMAIATGCHKKHYDLVTTKHRELFSLMHHVVTGDDQAVTKGKPSPEIYLVAFKRFEDPHLKTDQVLAFEDAPNGVFSAKAANLSCVMVPDSRVTAEQCKDADEVLGSLLELLPNEWGLPAYP